MLCGRKGSEKVYQNKFQHERFTKMKGSDKTGSHNNKKQRKTTLIEKSEDHLELFTLRVKILHTILKDINFNYIHFHYKFLSKLYLLIIVYICYNLQYLINVNFNICI